MIQNYLNQSNAVFNEIYRTLAQARTTDLPGRWVEKDDAWLGEIDLPGFSKEEVTVDIDEDGILTVEASLSAFEDETQERDFPRRDRNYRMTLPEEADVEALEGSLENGTLRLRVGKLTETKTSARRIELG